MGDPGLASKYIEAQMEDAERARYETVTINPLSPIEVERRESVRLSMARIQQQLERANNPKYKKMLKRALKDLRSEL